MTRRFRPRAVVFDLDGTLIDSLTLVLQAIAHALEPFAPRPTMDIFAHLGGPPERFLRTLLTDLSHVPAAMERMDAYHRSNMHLIQPFVGAVQLLENLRREGVQLAVWTGRDRASTDVLLRAHRLAEYFGVVVCGDDLPTHKPDPAGMREILRRLGIGPEEALFVGDADVDVLGGVACGVNTLLIRHARPIVPAISTQSWATVASPVEAFDMVRSCLGTCDAPAVDESREPANPL
jgi:HAD superfamily hydrolase (TIGR01509 family)